MNKIKKTFYTIPFALCLFTFSIFHQTSSIATVRYVSHSGTSTLPYTTWETAADSIQECINISSFGDTIYVANGVYEEQVTMIAGLSLFGAGMDSCIIDTRNLATGDYYSVLVEDSCLIKGFLVLASNDLDFGSGIRGVGENSLITLNKVRFGNVGIDLRNSEMKIYNNICSDNRAGIYSSHSISSIRKNIITSTESNSSGIILSSFLSLVSIIDSNHIFNTKDGIRIAIGTKPTITNNNIMLKDNGAGYNGSNSDTVSIFNNLILMQGGVGIGATGVPHLINNNLISDNKSGTGISATGLNNYLVQIKNNSIINSFYGIKNADQNSVYYNNTWGNQINYSNFTPDTTNLSVDPMIVNDDTSNGELDFHLQRYSPLIDAGDPSILDKDSTRSDIGLYGGPFGEVYKYQDLAPRPPVNLTGSYDSLNIEIKWNRNTEADFSYYKLFRDTTTDFTADTTNYVTSLTDTFYQHIIPGGINKYYYKLTAIDSQGNESGVSEELAVIITSVGTDYPAIVSNYFLYQNYPNPFNPSTKISYKLKERGYVKLYVYDIKGELISVLVNQTQEAGYYEVEFNTQVLSSEYGVVRQLASGIYIYQIMIKNENNIPVFSDIKKMLMIK